MKITQTNGNGRNGILGSRITVWNDKDEIVDRFVVPSQNARQYCANYPGGKYAQRLQKAIEKASK